MLAVDIDAERLNGLDSAGLRNLRRRPRRPAQRERLAAAARRFRLSRQRRGHSSGQADLRSHGRGLADASQTVNAESVFFLCQQIGARLNPGGAIVNLSSSSAKLATSVDVAAYAASKTTILSITRSFAYALAARPVRVNAICPGIVDTRDAGSGFSPASPPKRGTTAAELGRAAQAGRAARARRAAPRNAPASSRFCCRTRPAT